MSNSPLICYTNLSPNCSTRTAKIDTITIHCMAGNGSIEACGALFAAPSRQASSNYGIGSDGRIGMYVPEDKRSWCSNSRDNDQRAITIEVANNGGAPDWPVSDAALDSLIKLCTDICRRNGIKKLLWKGDKSLIGQVDKQNMTVHRWFANKACPGNYLYNKHGEIAAAVNTLLESGAPVDDVPGKTVAQAAPAATTQSSSVGSTTSGTGFRCRKIPLNKISRIQCYINSSRKSLLAIVKETGADYIVNGTLYNMTTWKPVENVKADGVVIASESRWSDPGFYWTTGADIKYGNVPADAGNASSYIFGNALLDANGNLCDVNWPSALAGSRGRTLMGIDSSNNLVFYSCLDGKAPLTPIAARAKMSELGCKKGAINLDGGASVGWYDKSGNTYQIPARTTVENYILVYLEESQTKDENPYPAPVVTLRRGASGNGVKYIQYALYALGYGNGSRTSFVDGSFGPTTQSAVIKFQQDKGLTADGVVGPVTLNALKACFK